MLSVSLGSAYVFTMGGPSGERVEVLLEPGSVLVMSGPARYAWRHGIAARKTDRWCGRTLARGRRVSLTFRTALR